MCIQKILAVLFSLSACMTQGVNKGSVIKGADSQGGAFHKLVVPETGLFVGATLGGASPSQYNERTQVNHALFVEFFQFPEILSQDSLKSFIDTFVNDVIATNGIPVLTLECFAGLNSYNNDQIHALAQLLRSYNYPIILRWNHEMNGAWYPWGQKPELYKEKFREFASVIHAEAPLVSMAWAPNQESRFPFSSLQYFNPAIDKNDPFGQFYPGDDAADIIGLSSFHWGFRSSGSDAQNVVPEPLAWYQGLKKFHDEFAVVHKKPMFVFETAAHYNPALQGADELTIKTAWLQQVFDADATRTLLPNLHGVVWFSLVKTETETGTRIIWPFETLPDALSTYRKQLQNSFFMKSEALQMAIRN